jgi:hypothetical protein
MRDREFSSSLIPSVVDDSSLASSDVRNFAARCVTVTSWSLMEIGFVFAVAIFFPSPFSWLKHGKDTSYGFSIDLPSSL